MRTVDKHRLGLVFGYYLGIIHIVWSLLVAVTPEGAQGLLEWTFKLHHIKMSVGTMSFNAGNALLLIVFTVGTGYATGWLLGWLWNHTGERGMRTSLRRQPGGLSGS